MYQLPFLRVQKGFVGHLLGGWVIVALGSFYSGGPLGVISSVNGTDSFGGGQRPNWNGVNPALPNPTPQAWFNTSVFSATPQFGTTPRTFSDVRSGWTRGVDLSLHKKMQFRDRFAFRCRVDSFNLSNTPVFAPPNTTYGLQQFGSVSSQANQPRILQFGMKLLF
jgi:hypothetical protein